MAAPLFLVLTGGFSVQLVSNFKLSWICHMEIMNIRNSEYICN
jgi:hypothetical protein